MTFWRRELLRGVRRMWKYSLPCGNNVEGLLLRINTWGLVPCTHSKEHFIRPITVVSLRILHSALCYHNAVNSWTSKRVYCEAHSVYNEEVVLVWLNILKVYSALWMKPTDALKFQFYWYYDSCVFRAAFLPIIRSS